MPAINPIMPLPILILLFGLTSWSIIRLYLKLDQPSPVKKNLTAVRLAVIAVLFVISLRPRLEYAEKKVQKDRLYFLQDHSLSMTIKDMPDNQSRLQYTRNLISDNRKAMTQLKEKFDIKEFSFAKDLKKKATLNKPGKQTAISDALLGSAADSRIQKVRGIILISDGINNTGSSINRTIAELKRKKIPVYTVLIGQSSYKGRIVDGIIQEVDCPQSVKKDSEIDISIQGIIRGLKGRMGKLQLMIDGKVTKEELIRCHLEEQNFFTSTKISLKGYKPGYHKITARLVTGNDEISPANNLLNNYFRIRDDGLKVLLIATAPSPDFKFLSRILSGFDDLSPVILNPFFSRTTEGRLFLNKLDIKEYDVVIMQNPDISLLPDEFLRKCNNLIKKRKLGLLITGEKFTQSILIRDILADYLLCKKAKASFREYKVSPQLTETGKSHIITSFMNDYIQENNKKTLPAFQGRLSGLEAVTGAEVLIENEKLPLLTTGTLDNCRIAWLNASGLWQWMTSPTSRKLYEQLWRRLIYYLAYREADLSTNLAIFSGKSRFSSEEEIPVTADFIDEKGVAIKGKTIALTYVAEGKTPLKKTFSPSGNRYRTELTIENEGFYTLKASSTHKNKPVESNEIKLLIREPRVEFEKILADPRFMANISQTTGGKSISPQQLPTLLEELSKSTQVRTIKTITRTKDAWDNIWFYLTATLLLSFEWYRRRKLGLQ